MNRWMVIIVVALVPLALTLRAEGRPDEAGIAPTPLVALSGPDSKILESGYFRISDRKAWVKLWHRHVGAEMDKHSEYYNPARVPNVDFDRVEVVAIFQGAAWNSAAVDVVEVVEKDGEVIFRFDDRSYQTMNGADKSSSYGLFFVPRTGMPIILFENVQGLIGGDPEWKKRARLE